MRHRVYGDRGRRVPDIPTRRVEDGDAPQATVPRREGIGWQEGQPFEISELPRAVPSPAPCVDVPSGGVEHQDVVSASVDHRDATAR